MKTISKKKVLAFQKKVFSWYKKNKRDLPWRNTTNPYHILVSEIMLQQTQVDRVVFKYNSFLKQFPALKALARAPRSKLLAAWSGLGYNRRALHLQRAAQHLVEKRTFPQTAEELQRLPGIGPYTSRSLLIFAFNKDEATIDTNIRRIFIHAFGLPEQIPEKALYVLAQKCLPAGKSREWHNALMDYGALHLTAKKTGIRPLSRQSPFQGSRRQYRGMLLQRLVRGESVTLTRLAKEWQKEKSWVAALVHCMEKEGLLRLQKGKVFL